MNLSKKLSSEVYKLSVNGMSQDSIPLEPKYQEGKRELDFRWRDKRKD
jgi:hypothetical protein